MSYVQYKGSLCAIFRTMQCISSGEKLKFVGPICVLTDYTIGKVLSQELHMPNSHALLSILQCKIQKN